MNNIKIKNNKIAPKVFPSHEENNKMLVDATKSIIPDEIKKDEKPKREKMAMTVNKPLKDLTPELGLGSKSLFKVTLPFKASLQAIASTLPP